MWSSNFTLKNVCTWDEPFKRLKQNKKLHTIFNYVFPQPTYLVS